MPKMPKHYYRVTSIVTLTAALCLWLNYETSFGMSFLPFDILQTVASNVFTGFIFVAEFGLIWGGYKLGRVCYRKPGQFRTGSALTKLAKSALTGIGAAVVWMISYLIITDSLMASWAVELMILTVGLQCATYVIWRFILRKAYFAQKVNL
jgi:hypothetical protein